MRCLCLFLLIFSYSNAQVGIGTIDIDNSAILEIESNNKGVLFPRVSLTSITSPLPVTSPTTGLIVYNIATSGVSPNNVLPGHYYWDGTKWEAFDKQNKISTHILGPQSIYTTSTRWSHPKGIQLQYQSSVATVVNNDVNSWNISITGGSYDDNVTDRTLLSPINATKTVPPGGTVVLNLFTYHYDNPSYDTRGKESTFTITAHSISEESGFVLDVAAYQASSEGGGLVKYW